MEQDPAHEQQTVGIADSTLNRPLFDVIAEIVADRSDPGIDPALTQEQEEAGGYGYQQVQAPLYAPGFVTITLPGGMEVSREVCDIDIKDIAQGSLGDCYLLASLAALAESNPEAIRNLITDNGDGTYTVHFASGDVTVDADFLATNGSLVGAEVSPDGSPELWVAIIEKAYAKLVGGNGPMVGEQPDGQGGFENVGGHAYDALYELTGGQYSYTSNDQQTPEMMQSALDQGPVTASSYRTDGSNGEPHPDIVGNHAYTVLGVTQDDAGAWHVELFNPWGNGEPLNESGEALDGKDDGKFTMTWEEYQEHFTGSTSLSE